MSTLDIKKSLFDASVKPGDVLFIHGDIVVAAQYKKKDKDIKTNFFKDILSYLGPSGTLVVPSFTYSFTRNKDFNRQISRSTLGDFSETFRKIEGVKRSRQPIFSICSIGKFSDKFVSADVKDCFGVNSGFDLLYKFNAKLMNLACPFEQTFLHYVEQCFHVDYRYFKNFSGNIIDHEKKTFVTTKYYVGKKEINYKQDMTILKRILLDEKKLLISPFGRFASYTVSSHDYYNCCMELLKENMYSLVEEDKSV